MYVGTALHYCFIYSFSLSLENLSTIFFNSKKKNFIGYFSDINTYNLFFFSDSN